MHLDRSLENINLQLFDVPYIESSVCNDTDGTFLVAIDIQVFLIADLIFQGSTETNMIIRQRSFQSVSA